METTGRRGFLKRFAAFAAAMAVVGVECFKHPLRASVVPIEPSKPKPSGWTSTFELINTSVTRNTVARMRNCNEVVIKDCALIDLGLVDLRHCDMVVIENCRIKDTEIVVAGAKNRIQNVDVLPSSTLHVIRAERADNT